MTNMRRGSPALKMLKKDLEPVISAAVITMANDRLMGKSGKTETCNLNGTGGDIGGTTVQHLKAAAISWKEYLDGIKFRGIAPKGCGMDQVELWTDVFTPKIDDTVDMYLPPIDILMKTDPRWIAAIPEDGCKNGVVRMGASAWRNALEKLAGNGGNKIKSGSGENERPISV